MSRNDSGRAIECCEQALAIDREVGDMLGLAIDSFNMANILAEQDRYREALPYAEESASILEKIGHADKAHEARQRVAMIHAKLDRQTSGTAGGATAMKTYRDDEHGFEIDIPENWSHLHDTLVAILASGARFTHGWKPPEVMFGGGRGEVLNIVIEPMMPEPSPGSTQLLVTNYAMTAGFTDVKFGRITIGGKDHTWATYVADKRAWTKKYMIVLGGKGFAITATCNAKETFLQREKVWDAIASSFRLLAPRRG